MKSYLKCNCANLKPALITKTIRIGGQSVEVQDAPARVCQDCGEIYLNGKYILKLEEKILRQRRLKS